MTWHATEMPNDALDPDSLVGRMLNADPVRPELLQEATEFLDEYAEDFKALAAAERAELPLSLWQVLAPILDDCILEALRDLDDPEAAPDPYHPERRQEVYDVIEALRDWLLPDATTWYPHRDLHAILTNQARIARGESFHD